MRRAFTVAIASVVVLLAAGTAYEFAHRDDFRKRYPQVGRSVDIGGRSLNIYCVGTGSPTVIFNSGLGAPGYEWIGIQAQIAQFTRACWYDRANSGWSDPGPLAGTPDFNAKDLHALLQAASVAPPYILVGASFGGYDSRVFASHHQTEVAGMVLVDASHEEEDERIPASMRAPVVPRHLRPLLIALAKLLTVTGIMRLTGGPPRQDQPPSDMTAERWATFNGLRNRPEARAAVACVGILDGASGRQAHAAKSLGDLPLIVLTAGQPQITTPDAIAYHQIWMHELQPKLARLSTRGRQVIVEKSTHSIAPDAVIGAIREILATAGNKTPAGSF